MVVKVGFIFLIVIGRWYQIYIERSIYRKNISLKTDIKLYIVVVEVWGKIEELANRKGLTIYALAKKAGVNYQMLAELKSGRKMDMMFSNVVKIADALGVSTEEFR